MEEVTSRGLMEEVAGMEERKRIMRTSGQLSSLYHMLPVVAC